MDVTVVPCLRDNYAYLLRAPGSDDAVVVDPSEAEPVLRALSACGARLVGILCTHHHADHVGGNRDLVTQFPGIPVLGHVSDRGRIPELTRAVEHGGAVDIAGLHFDVLHIPGHTLGAIAYVGHGAVFTGDTLFGAGCGRLFEGTAAMMYESLNVKLGALPDETRVYCGHEYTASNLKFASHVEPQNPAVRERAERVAELDRRGEPSVPSTLGEERATNPFLRCDAEEIRAAVAAKLGAETSPEAVLGALRAAKDVF